MDVTSQFPYRGTYTDYENTFKQKIVKPMQVRMASSRDIAVLRSKEWLYLDDLDTELLAKTLMFRLSSFIRFSQTRRSSAPLKLSDK